MNKPCPCRYCVAPKRYPGCHSKCGDYIDWNKELQQEKEIIREARREYEDCFPPRLRKPKRRRYKRGNHTNH